MNLLVERAVRCVGGQASLARKCGVSQAHVWHWLHKTRRVPAERVLAIESATGGHVSRHELRPDIYPPPDRDAAA
ncbi:MAG: transcriptional regulator [Alphaproteobacteria bacterium]